MATIGAQFMLTVRHTVLFESAGRGKIFLEYTLEGYPMKRRTLHYYTKADLPGAGVSLSIHRLRVLMREGHFPRSFQLGPGGAAMWVADEVDQFVRDRERVKATQEAVGLGRHSGNKVAA
jgi:hypothetical protein